jgi:ribosomal RNA-processing protein 8
MSSSSVVKAKKRSQPSSSTTATPQHAKKNRTVPPSKQPPLSHFDKLRKQLAAGQFRMLNEQLYKEPGHAALARYRSEPDTFATYHSAYKEQVALWPFNPLDRITDELCESLATAPTTADDDAAAAVVVADFGCGEANLARVLRARLGDERVSVRSFDLVADAARGIEAADLARVPLADSSVDVVVLCLALMGTDWPRFLREARRVLKPNGTLKLAEVGSRFTDRVAFVQALRHAGFKVRELQDGTDFFLRFDCTLSDKRAKSDNAAVAQLKAGMLRPCLYKRR